MYPPAVRVERSIELYRTAMYTMSLIPVINVLFL